MNTHALYMLPLPGDTLDRRKAIEWLEDDAPSYVHLLKGPMESRQGYTAIHFLADDFCRMLSACLDAIEGPLDVALERGHEDEVDPERETVHLAALVTEYPEALAKMGSDAHHGAGAHAWYELADELNRRVSRMAEEANHRVPREGPEGDHAA